MWFAGGGRETFMAMQWIWVTMMGGSLIYACLCGHADVMLEAALNGTAGAISLTIRLGAGYLLFCGLMEIMKAVGAARFLGRFIRRALCILMPSVRSDQTREAVAMNLSMNLLGLGNAATPAGMQAMRLMEEERLERPAAIHDMYMLLILNATSIQLLPTTVLSLRVAAGSVNANAILLPSLLCTVFSTVVGVVPALLWRKRHE